MHNRIVKNGLKWISASILSTATMAPVIAAQDPSNYPNKPITVIVGFAPGGPTDVQARMLANKLGPILGQTVVVENKPGASTTIALADVARAKPDGYTVYMGGSGAYATTPLVMQGLTYNPATSFAPITMVGEEQIAVAVHPSVPAKNISELLDLAKKNPGKLAYASSGHGNITHLTGELIKHAAGSLDLVHVAYKGAAPAVNDAVAGHVDVIIGGLGSVYPLHQDGKLRVLAITSTKRVPYADDIPTISEAGVQDVNASTTLVLLAPAGTPEQVVTRLDEAVKEVIKQPEYQAAMRAAYVEPITDSTPANTADLLTRELDQWKSLVDASGIDVQ